MSRGVVVRIGLLLGSVALLAGCGPVLSVTNGTKVPVRVVVNHVDGSETFEPSPGESSTVEVAQGRYSVTAIPDAAWTNYAMQTRQYLNDQLANSNNLSGPQLLDLVHRLKDIAAKMDEMKKAAGTNATCAGTVSQHSNPSATVSIGANGQLVIACK